MRCTVFQALSGPVVERIHRLIELDLSHSCKTYFFMQLLAQQSVIDAGLKTRGTEEARILDGLVRRTVAALKKRFPELGIITDIALEPNASPGQGGLINNTGYELNDESISMLTSQLVVHRQTSAGGFALSDVVDGWSYASKALAISIP